jgi:hypothetical protein
MRMEASWTSKAVHALRHLFSLCPCALRACVHLLRLGRYGLPLIPQPLEAATRHARVVHGMPGIAMPEIVLHGAQVGALIGKIVAAGVP